MQPLAPSQNIHIIERFLLYSMYVDSSHAWLPGGFAYKSGLHCFFAVLTRLRRRAAAMWERRSAPAAQGMTGMVSLPFLAALRCTV